MWVEAPGCISIINPIPYPPEAVARDLMRVVFTFVAEDVRGARRRCHVSAEDFLPFP
jgi:hypothetical protein